MKKPKIKRILKNIISILDRISGFIFTIAILVAKLKFVPIAFVSGIANTVSLSLYLISYVLWTVATHYYPKFYHQNQIPRPPKTWYSFIEFRNQNKIAAIIGTLAVILSFLAFLFPITIVPSVWFFLISNLLWSISHYHKLKNALGLEKSFEKENQKTFLIYTVLTTLISVVTAICITAALLFPLAAPLLGTVSTVLGLTFTFLAMCYLIRYYVSPCFNKKKDSHSTMIKNGLTSENSAKLTPNPPQPQAPLPSPIHNDERNSLGPQAKKNDNDYNDRSFSFGSS